MRTHESFNAKRLRLANPQDFGKLYDYFSPRIWRHVFLRTNSTEETEDITAKVFLKTWEYVRARNKVKNVRALLYKIADNLIIDWYRTRTPLISLDSETFEEKLDVPDTVDVHEAVINNFDAARARELILKLRPHEQAILVMRFIDDMSIEEIAESTGKPKGTVAVSIHRALKTLANMQQGQEKTI